MKTTFTLSLILAACAVEASDLYVAPSRGDATASGDGTESRPFTSLTQARNAIRTAKQAGDTSAWTVHLSKGAYPVTETIVFEPCDSGTADAPVAYAGEGEGTQVMGGIRIDHWDETRDGDWIADIPQLPDGTPAYFESLFVNGHRAVRARHPNTGFLNPLSLKQTLCTNAQPHAEYATASIVGHPGDLRPLTQTPKEELRYAQVVVHHNWDTTRRIIVGFDAETDALLTQGSRWKPWNPWRTNSLYYVENVRSAFDAPGEWFYDGCRGKILYRPRRGERRPGCWFGSEVFAPVPGLQTLLAFKGDPSSMRFVSHVCFKNMAFVYTDSPRRPDQVDKAFIAPSILGAAEKPGPTQFEPMQAAARTEAAIMADGAHNLTFENCEVAHTGEYGIWFRAGCVSNRIAHCALTDLGGGGVRIGDPGGKGASIGSNTVATACTPFSTAFNVVDNCIIKEGGRFHASATAVWVGHSPDNRIAHNEISDHYYTGVSVGWVWGYKGSVAQRNTIAFNRIHKIGQGALGDMGGVYTLGTSFGTHICDNVIFDVDSYTYGGWGLYPDEGSEGITFENNLVYNTKDSSFHQHYGRDNIVRNNIFGYSRECQVAFSRIEPHRSATIEGNIIYWDNGPTFSGRYKGSDKAKVEWKRNLWWRSGGTVDFNGKTFAEWQAMGRDTDGVVADPLFINPSERDFRLKQGSPADKIGFQAFDFSQAGVYGERAWRRRAQQ